MSTSGEQQLFCSGSFLMGKSPMSQWLLWHKGLEAEIVILRYGTGQNYFHAFFSDILITNTTGQTGVASSASPLQMLPFRFSCQLCTGQADGLTTDLPCKAFSKPYMFSKSSHAYHLSCKQTLLIWSIFHSNQNHFLFLAWKYVHPCSALSFPSKISAKDNLLSTCIYNIIFCLLSAEDWTVPSIFW